ncbi:MAG TPA: YceI family protein [Gemmatimonadota bacterium]|nr:YceI family protein [Gemmatimonadota bacterium]
MRTSPIVVALALGVGTGAIASRPPAPLEGRLYRLDPAHSSVEFSVRYLRLMEVEGRFAEWDAALIGPESPERGTIAVAFRTASLDTGNDTRDDHLRSGDFFDAEAYPLITFVSEEVVKRGDGFVARGPLVMHGVTRQIEVPFRPAYAPMVDGKGNARVGFTGELTIDRRDFGIEGGNAFNAGFDPLVSIIDDEVRIRFGLHAMIPPLRSGPVDSLLAAVESAGVAEVVAAWHRNPPPAGDDEASTRARARSGGIFNAAGFRLIEAGRAADAVELLRVSVLALPGSARALAGLAEGYARAGQDAAALENADRALAIDPAEARALVVKHWVERRRSGPTR